MSIVRNQAFELCGEVIQPGERKTIDLKIGSLYAHSELSIPVQVLCGRQAGPTLFVSAAIHGDELNGVEIIRRLLKVKSLNKIKGNLIAVPIVNLHGFIHNSRYLPDRRDLNRCFPGSESGSLAARMAHLFLNEIVAKCTHGIDLHTGAIHRSNLPQIRANLDKDVTMRMAQAFDAPVIMDSELRKGSLRASAVKLGIPILLYEAGEALRFDELGIRAGVRGILNVMRELEMLPLRQHPPTKPSQIARSSFWIRAETSGIFRSRLKDGQRVLANETLLGVLSDPFGESEVSIYSPYNGIIIGQMKLPLVNEGEALFHIARFARSDAIENQVDAMQETLQSEAKLPYPSEDIPEL